MMGQADAAPRPTRLEATQVVATLCVTALTAGTAIGLCRVFPDWRYLPGVLAVVIGTHLVAAVLRLLRVPLVVALPLMLFTILELLARQYYRATMNGPFATSRTLDLMRLDVRLVVDQFSTAVAPVPSVGNWAVAAAAALALCAAMSDTFAFRAMGRMETVVPTGVVFVFTAALGTDRHRVAVAALWVGLALLVVAVLRFRFTSEDSAWMGARRLGLAAALPTIAVTVGLTAVVAAAVAPVIPGAGKQALVDTRNRNGSITEVLSPIVNIGGQLRTRGNLELFTVASSDGPHYWREIGLRSFDGRSWEPTEETLRTMGDRSSEVPFDGVISQQRITIKGLGGHLLPAAQRPVKVDPPQLKWTADSESLVLPKTELKAKDEIVVISKRSALTPDILRAQTNLGVDPEYTTLPTSVPASVIDMARQVTAGATTAYDMAIALQNWFRSEFTYDTNVQFNNSNDAMVSFLTIKRGFCQQFAGTFAVMARALGLPARVAVGFTAGELGADGLYHVYGKHAHAWPEIWFDGIGWVAFEPTPTRGNGDTTSYTGVDAAQDNTPAQPGDTTTGTAPAPDGGITSTTTTVSTQPAVTTTTTAPSVGGTGGRGDSSGGSTGSRILFVLMLALAAAAVWALTAPRVVRALAHRHDNTPSARVVSAWQRTLGTLQLAGAPPVAGATPLEYVAVAERSTGADHRALRELAVNVTKAVYSPSAIEANAASRCESLAHEIDVLCRERIPLSTRVKLLFDLRLMRNRWAR